MLAGAFGVVLSAAERSHAETEVEAAGSVGTSTGGWICGPVGRAVYAGGHAQVGYSPGTVEQPDRPGVMGTVGGSAEHETVTLVERRCDEDCTEDDATVPPSAALYGVHARAGYRWRSFGISAGVAGWNAFVDNTADKPEWAHAAQLEMQLGRRSRATFRFGIGVPSATMSRRPGLYFRVNPWANPRLPASLEFGTGLHRESPANQLGTRYAAVGRLRMLRWLSARAGVAATLSDSWGGEGNLGLTARF